MPVAVIVDIIGSRGIADRVAAQRALDDTVAAITDAGPTPTTALHPIVGDELQGVYGTLDHALAAILLFRLALPAPLDCRFGLGIGAVGTIPSATGDISEGPGWWAARDAIETVERMQRRSAPGLRTWVAASVDGDLDPGAVRRANAYLLARDELVTNMPERTRRLAYGRCLGLTQRALAEDEGVTQSAVSQALASAGGSAVVEGYRLLAMTG
ncbi:SatD family protein [Microbacterium sp. BWT-B31]|uniref:SatD family protein n=1 Tax=Microbacterium sp. BWT-B31 TaxID=3232072 RepID=UPI003528757C